MRKSVRAAVTALVLTGAAASLHTPSASAQKTNPRPTDLPIPMCPPNDPNACGIVRPW